MLWKDTVKFSFFMFKLFASFLFVCKNTKSQMKILWNVCWKTLHLFVEDKFGNKCYFSQLSECNICKLNMFAIDWLFNLVLLGKAANL